ATCNGSLSTCNGSLSTCNGSLQTCNQDVSACEAALAASAPPASCAEIHSKHPELGDGVYTIQPAGIGRIQVKCLMSADGGGWTQVGNFATAAGSTAGVPGWTGGGQVGTAFTDPAAAWKLSDAVINLLVTKGYRAHGSATQCVQGPCSVDTT